MEPGEFWALIGDAVDDPGLIERRVGELSEQDLVDFYWECRGNASSLVDDEHLDDEDRHVRAQWVVQQGHDVWERVRFNRSRLPSEVPEFVSYAALASAEYLARYEREVRGHDDPPATELLWERFWLLIDAGRDDPSAVQERLEAMTGQEVVNFWWRFQDAVDTITWEGQDEVVAAWVVQQGKAHYDTIVARPGRFPISVPDDAGRSYQDEAAAVYERRYGEAIPARPYPEPEYLTVEPSEFWALIDSGLDDPTVVERRIEAMTEQELVDFFWGYQDAVDELTDDPFTQNFFYRGAYSEGHHEDIAEWVVRMGRRFYEVHLDPKRFPVDDTRYGRFSYQSVTVSVYRDRYGDVIRDPDEPPPEPPPPRRRSLRARLFGHGDP